jgi:hypothetical protein
MGTGCRMMRRECEVDQGSQRKLRSSLTLFLHKAEQVVQELFSPWIVTQVVQLCAGREGEGDSQEPEADVMAGDAECSYVLLCNLMPYLFELLLERVPLPCLQMGPGGTGGEGIDAGQRSRRRGWQRGGIPLPGIL